MIARAKSDFHVKRLCRLVDEALVALGFGFKPVAYSELYESTHIDFPVPFYERDALDSVNHLSEVVLQTLTMQLRSVRKYLMDRYADIETGLQVVGAFDMAGRSDWDESMPRWGVAVRWQGPKPDFWPHPISAKDMAPPKDSEIVSDHDFKEKYGEDPTVLYKRSRDKRTKEN